MTIFIIVFLVCAAIFLVWAGKNGGFSTNRNSQIILREVTQ